MRQWLPGLAAVGMIWAALAGAAVDAPPRASDTQSDALEAAVTRMARIGAAFGPALSPDGAQVAYVSNLSGVFQVWTVATAGGYPRLVTAFDDPVGNVAWSRDGEWLAFDVSPGGGLNTQIYLARPDGTEVRRITSGGEVNNNLGFFSDNGRWLSYTSNERDPAATDPYLYELATGRATRVLEGAGITDLADLSADGKHALVFRLRSRGSNDLYLRDLASGEERELTTHSGPGTFFGDIAPDGTHRLPGLEQGPRPHRLRAHRRVETQARPARSKCWPRATTPSSTDFVLDDAGERAVLVWNVAGRNELELFDLADGTRRPLARAAGRDRGRHRLHARRRASRGRAAGRGAAAATCGCSTSPTAATASSPSARTRASTWPRWCARSCAASRPTTAWSCPAGSTCRPASSEPGPVVLSFHGGPEGQERPVFRSDYQALLAQRHRRVRAQHPRLVGLRQGVRQPRQRRAALRRQHATSRPAPTSWSREGIGATGRLGIMGGSYGGYVVMVAVTEYPDTFAAGANLFGMVNFETFFSQTHAVDGRDLHRRVRRPEDAAATCCAALAASTSSTGCTPAAGAARRQRHQRAGGRGRAGGRQR